MKTKARCSVQCNKTQYFRAISPIIFLICLFFVACEKDDNPDIQTFIESVTPTESGQSQTNEFQFGVLLLPAEEYKNLPVAEMPNTLPKDLAASTMIQTPPVGNQGAKPASIAFATTYAARSIMWKKNHPALSFNINTNIFSPEYVYSQPGSSYWVTTVLNLLKIQGACRWSLMPYLPNASSIPPNSTQINDAKNFRISGYGTVVCTVNAIKSQLNCGYPIVVAGPVSSQFMNLTSGVILKNRVGNVGNHCYCVVGYDDSKNAFKVMNSFGTNWGNSGYGWIDYGYISQWWSELYRINN